MLRSLITTAAAGFDRAFGAAVLGRSERSRQRSSAESLGHEDRLRLLAEIAAEYDRPEYYTDPDAFFRAPAPAACAEERVRSYGAHGEVIDVAWPSGYDPYCSSVTEHYLSHRENHTAVARVFRHRAPARSAVILVHGYMGGNWHLEERAWPLRWMFGRGLDVALVALPFHGVRRNAGAHGRARPFFPSSDPRITNEGFRQSVHDLRSLVSYLQSRGARDVGVMGMSLGGYTTALLATVEHRLAFAVPIIPLASIADFARDGGRLVGTEEQQALQHAALERANRVVSPLARPPKLSADRVLVVAGEGDRITPVKHARRIAEHFGAPIETFYGGHILQLGRGEAFRAVGRMMGRLGVLGP